GTTGSQSQSSISGVTLIHWQSEMSTPSISGAVEASRLSTQREYHSSCLASQLARCDENSCCCAASSAALGGSVNEIVWTTRAPQNASRHAATHHVSRRERARESSALSRRSTEPWCARCVS